MYGQQLEDICKLPTWRVSVRLRLHFLKYTFVLDIHCQQLVNMCQLNILVLNIFCQQLGDIRQFDDVFVPFGHSVGKSEFSRVYICVLFIHCFNLYG